MSDAEHALSLADYLETDEKTDAVTIGLSDAALAAKALRALATLAAAVSPPEAPEAA